jgi:hypothetical protein
MNYSSTNNKLLPIVPSFLPPYFLIFPYPPFMDPLFIHASTKQNRHYFNILGRKLSSRRKNSVELGEHTNIPSLNFSFQIRQIPSLPPTFAQANAVDSNKFSFSIPNYIYSPPSTFPLPFHFSSSSFKILLIFAIFPAVLLGQFLHPPSISNSSFLRMTIH